MAEFLHQIPKTTSKHGIGIDFEISSSERRQIVHCTNDIRKFHGSRFGLKAKSTQKEDSAVGGFTCYLAAS